MKSRDRRSAGAQPTVRPDSPAADLDRDPPPQQRPETRHSAVLNAVNALRMLSDADRAQLEQHMRLGAYPAKDIVLSEGVVPDAIFIFESGVVSVSLQPPDGCGDVGPMEPGELLGRIGFVDATPTLAFLRVYRLHDLSHRQGRAKAVLGEASALGPWPGWLSFLRRFGQH